MKRTAVMTFILTAIRSLFGRAMAAGGGRTWTDVPTPDGTKHAYLGLGCFWAPDGQFPAVAGVYRTRVGYAGGERQAPTYRNIMDHTEVIEVEYDPAQISYGQLLDRFWDFHDGTIQMKKRQYISLVLFDGESEKADAQAAKERAQVKKRSPIVTKIAAFDQFYEAEGYHQKYHLQCDSGVTSTFGLSAPADLTGTVLAGRLNALVMGHGTQTLVDELRRHCELSQPQLELVNRLLRDGGTGAAVCH